MCPPPWRCPAALPCSRAATARAFERATHIVKLQTGVQRVTGVPLEPRAAVGSHDRATGRTTLYAGSGGVVRQKHELASVLDVPADRIRVVSGDVGGNFGTRNAFYPEFALVAWASRRIARPIKWTCERHEAFLSDYQGRDLFVEAELALDAEGRFLALRGSNISNVGAHTVSFVPLTKGVSVMSSIYHIPAAWVRARAVMSNTPPTNPYLSAGREWTKIMVLREGRVDVAIGSLPSGQGHRTSFAQLVTDWLGVPFDCVNLIQGDTDIVPVGGGSHSGRSMRLAGIVIGNASDALIAKAQRIAAHSLQAAEHDIEFSRGNFLVKGTDRSIGIFDVAREALGRNDLVGELSGPLAAESDETVTVGGCPYGSHVCEVEVDLELGTLEIVGYAAVDDVA